MAHNLSSALNANKQEIQNPRFHNLGATPSTPAVGQYWFNTGDGFVYYRDHTGVDRQMVHFTAMLATRLDQFAAPSISLSLNNQKITNLLDPTNLQDAATKAYVDAMVAGLRWKDACRVATTSTITRSGTQTIDGVAVVAGDRVAVLDGTVNAGIWVVAAGAWARATDADTAAEVYSMSFFVQEGTANGNAQYTCTTDNPITLGSTILNFAKVGAGVSYTVGLGIILTGSTLSIDTSVVSRKIGGLLGNGSATSFTVTHNLNSQDLVAGLWKVSTGEMWLPDVSFTGGSSTTQCTFNFGFAPTTNEYRWVLQG